MDSRSGNTNHTSFYGKDTAAVIGSALTKLNKFKININLEGFAIFHYKNLPEVANNLILLKQKYGALLTDEIVNVAVKYGDREGGAIAEALIISQQAGIAINLEKFAQNNNMPMLAEALLKLKNETWINFESLAEDIYQDLPSVARILSRLEHESQSDYTFLARELLKEKIPMTKSLLQFFNSNRDLISYMSDFAAGFASLIEANFSLTSDLQRSFFHSLEITNSADATKEIQDSFKLFLAKLINENDQENTDSAKHLAQILKEMPENQHVENKDENRLIPIAELKILPRKILECVSAFFQPPPLTENNSLQETPEHAPK